MGKTLRRRGRQLHLDIGQAALQLLGARVASSDRGLERFLTNQRIAIFLFGRRHFAACLLPFAVEALAGLFQGFFI
ncbi:hypothetical protein DP43_2945 [Burkholderia pseudomallei]|nr:hypothetical protein DP43_2945 [Burkholderia pseudomallei]